MPLGHTSPPKAAIEVAGLLRRFAEMVALNELTLCAVRLDFRSARPGWSGQEQIDQDAEDAAIRFDDLSALLESLGFDRRFEAAITCSVKQAWKRRSTCNGMAITQNPTKSDKRVRSS